MLLYARLSVSVRTKRALVSRQRSRASPHAPSRIRTDLPGLSERAGHVTARQHQRTNVQRGNSRRPVKMNRINHSIKTGRKRHSSVPIPCRKVCTAQPVGGDEAACGQRVGGLGHSNRSACSSIHRQYIKSNVKSPYRTSRIKCYSRRFPNPDFDSTPNGQVLPSSDRVDTRAVSSTRHSCRLVSNASTHQRTTSRVVQYCIVGGRCNERRDMTL